MGNRRRDGRRRPSITLDAGYVCMASFDINQTWSPLGLHGKKLFCVLCTIIVLLIISIANLTCLVWLMYKLDWSFVNRSGSKLFRIDHNQPVEFYKRTTFTRPIYTTKIKYPSLIEFASQQQTDIYGDYNSIRLNSDQISMTTEYFHLNNGPPLDFANFHSLKFNRPTTTRILLNQLNSQHIHSSSLNLTARKNLTISHVNDVHLYSQRLSLEANMYNRQSTLHFGNHPKKRTSSHRHTVSNGNLRLRSDSMFLALPRLPWSQNNNRDESSAFRVCICNTTFLLLRSFAYQPCPLC